MCSHRKWLRSTRHLILLIDRNELQNVKVISYLKKSSTEVDKTTRSIFLALTFMYIPFPRQHMKRTTEKIVVNPDSTHSLTFAPNLFCLCELICLKKILGKLTA